MGLIARLLLGNGTLESEVHARLASEGLVLVEENLPGSIRYHNFRAPGKYFDRKIQAQRFGLGLSRKGVALYCRSGRSRVIDSPYDDYRMSAIGVSLDEGEAVVLDVDFDRGTVPGVSGRMIVRVRSPNAARIVGELSARMRDQPG